MKVNYLIERLRSLPKKARFALLILPFGTVATVLALFSSEEQPITLTENEKVTLAMDTLKIDDYPKDFFRNPLDIPINLSGNFGELRTNHFHAGIDIKTNQQEGLKVYAAGEGYVSRIKVSGVGYGYALYITHPNGFTTVYGHLQSYSAKIDEYLKKEQYKQELFAVDVFPDPKDLPVTRGEVVALSGNTGGSGGPHLHFEIRETVTEKTLNPLLFGFDVKDNIAPSINSIWIVPMSDSTWVNGTQTPVSYPAVGSGANMGIKATVTPVIYGDVGFAIHTSDMLNGNANRCGIYRIELFVDGLQVYGQRMNRLDFTTNRAMNAHTIYERFKKDRSQLHGSYRLPGNPLDIYDNLVNDGIVTFKDDKEHELIYRVEDINGNKSLVKFKVKGTLNKGKLPPAKSVMAHFDWEKDNNYADDKLKISIPAYTLYEDLGFSYQEKGKMEGGLINTLLVASPYEPVHNKYTLCLKADKVPSKYRDKAVVVRYDPDKDKTSSEGGIFKDGWICAEPTYLGYFNLKIDTVAPSITPTTFKASMPGAYSFSFKVSDWLSGIDQIIPKIDGKWVLMELDGKSGRLTCYYDKTRMTRGSHEFELTLIDVKGNSKVYKSKFTW